MGEDPKNQAIERWEANAREIEMVPGKGLVCKDAAGLWLLAGIYERSGTLPTSIANRESAFMAMQFGMELGLSPTECLRSVYFVNKRPALYGDVPLGLVRRSGLMAEFSETLEGVGDKMVATCRCRRKDSEHEFVATFSMDDARAAGLARSGMYDKYRGRMLKYRARGFCLRDAFPEVLMGAYSVEELEGSEDRPVREPRARAEVLTEAEISDALASAAPDVVDAEVKDPPRADLFDGPTDEDLANQEPFDPSEVES